MTTSSQNEGGSDVRLSMLRAELRRFQFYRSIRPFCCGVERTKICCIISWCLPNFVNLLDVYFPPPSDCRRFCQLLVGNFDDAILPNNHAPHKSI